MLQFSNDLLIRGLHGPKFLGPARPGSSQARPARPVFKKKIFGPARDIFGPARFQNLTKNYWICKLYCNVQVVDQK